MRSVAELEMTRPRVLVVDDSASTCLLVASALQQKGYDVKIAHNGQDGLTKTMIFQPHCLILDVLLPGMSGYTVCRQVRQRLGQQLPHIILISTKDTALDQHYGLHQGANRYLPKPFTEEILLQAVWEGVPATVRQTISPPLSCTPTPRPTLWELVPRRIPNREAMRTSSPFAPASVTTDEQARRLYVAIDGRKTVAELAIMTGLKTKDVSKLLGVLLLDRCIELQDAKGQLVEKTLGSVSSWGDDLAN